MSVGGGFPPAVLETLEFPAALERVAAFAAGPLGAARVQERRPAIDADGVRDALAQVAELAALLITDAELRAEPVPDIGETLRLLGVPGSALEGPALAELAVALVAARLVGAILGRLERDAPRTAALRAPLPPKQLETRLAAAIAPDGAVLDGASRDLARARKAVRDARTRLVARLERLLQGIDSQDRAPDAAVTLRAGRYVIPVRAAARGKIGGIVHDESATRATVFLEPPEVIELGNELRAAEADEHREVLRVLRELTDALRPHRDTIATAWEACIAFDDLCARARYAVEVNGFAPEIGGGPLKIRGGRHPLLVSGETVVIPFDLELASDEWTVLISGPNTGGKTVLIKAVGLLALLVQSGVIPPLGPHSRLPVFARMFADIGDRQSIAASLSTFSAHVAVLRDILAFSDGATLVLLDEIGSGTDPAEGAALAGATLRSLTRRHAVTLATTHLGALKRLAAESVGIVNASLQFDAASLTPTYRLLKGLPGRSYGLAIARRLGVADDVLADAEQAVPDAERQLDALLADVEARARALVERETVVGDAEAAAATERTRLEAREQAAAERERGVVERERTLDARAREQARAYLLEARKTVEAALGQARAAVDEATAREARRLLERAIAEVKGGGQAVGRSDDNSGGPEAVRVGDRVRTTDGMVGTVSELRGDGDLVIEAGALRIVVSRAAIAAIIEQQSTARPPDRPRPTGSPLGTIGSPDRPTTVAETEVSLRGLRADEAEAVLERALDAAVLDDLPFLRIIHGKGTGALRDLVQRILQRDPRVARFGLAPANQGGSGVTVVELR
ncbi:MAG TPA: Smr/MutS family protein [Gemmatimonadales bacterium]|nr:Smr/MutS family protein [Gemmatimonadales bacterium]